MDPLDCGQKFKLIGGCRSTVRTQRASLVRARHPERSWSCPRWAWPATLDVVLLTRSQNADWSDQKPLFRTLPISFFHDFLTFHFLSRPKSPFVLEWEGKISAVQRGGGGEFGDKGPNRDEDLKGHIWWLTIRCYQKSFGDPFPGSPNTSELRSYTFTDNENRWLHSTSQLAGHGGRGTQDEGLDRGTVDRPRLINMKKPGDRDQRGGGGIRP